MRRWYFGSVSGMGYRNGLASGCPAARKNRVFLFEPHFGSPIVLLLVHQYLVMSRFWVEFYTILTGRGRNGSLLCGRFFIGGLGVLYFSEHHGQTIT